MKKTEKDLLAIIESEGLFVRRTNIAKGSHVKFHVSYKGHDFFIASGTSKFSPRKPATFRGDVRRIKHAIDEGNAELIEKYTNSR